MEQSPTDPVPTNPYEMSAQQATAKLAEMKVAYDSQNTPQPTSPAAARLQEIESNPKLVEAYLGGSPAIRREVEDLHKQIAENAQQPPQYLVEVVDSISDRNALSRRNYATAIDGMRERPGGLPERREAYARAIDAGLPVERPTSGDKVIVQAALKRLNNSAEFRRRIESGDIPANRLFSTLGDTLGFAVDDGKPPSPLIVQYLADQGLG